MSTLIKVEACTKEPRIWQGKTTWGVKTPDKGWVTLYREQKPDRGEEIDVNITERKGKNGMIYVDAFPVMPPLAVQAGIEKPKENGKKHLNQFVMAEALEFWFQRVNTFEWADDAKASVLCTLLIGTSDGRIQYELPPEDEYVPPNDDEMPPF